MFSTNMPEKLLDIYSALLPIYIISTVLGLVPFTYGKTISKTTTRSFVSSVYSGFVLLLILGWFILSIIFDSLYHYTQHTSMYIIPVVSKLSTVFGATMAALINCHRGALQHVCQKLLLIDQILLVPSKTYKRRRLTLTAEMIVVFSATGAMHFFDMNDRNMGYITTMETVGWILVSYINNTVILQFLSCVRIVKDRFEKLNTQLSAMIAHEFEEEELNTFLSNLNLFSRRLGHSIEGRTFGRGTQVASGSLSGNIVLKKTRGRVFRYDPAQIRSLRLTHSVLYKLTRAINSDFGVQILLEMLHSFISLIMAMYVALTGRPDPHLATCGEDASCVRVVTNFCLAAVCVTKFVAISAFSHAASDEIARTPALVRRLLLQHSLGTDTLTEIQLFSQQMSNIDTKFTAFGFFTLNLNLLINVAAAATTYIVILLQSRSMTGV
jgi:hypothetical protein